MLLTLAYTSHPLLPHPWALVASFLIRFVPVMLYFRLRGNPDCVSRSLRATALGLGILSVSLSFLLIVVSVGKSVLGEIPGFWIYYLEGTPDTWPCAVMLLCVESRATERGKGS